MEKLERILEKLGTGNAVRVLRMFRAGDMNTDIIKMFPKMTHEELNFMDSLGLTADNIDHIEQVLDKLTKQTK